MSSWVFMLFWVKFYWKSLTSWLMLVFVRQTWSLSFFILETKVFFCIKTGVDCFIHMGFFIWNILILLCEGGLFRLLMGTAFVEFFMVCMMAWTGLWLRWSCEWVLEWGLGWGWGSSRLSWRFSSCFEPLLLVFRAVLWSVLGSLLWNLFSLLPF